MQNATWKIIFFPLPGSRHSPVDFLNRFLDEKEKSTIALKLEVLAEIHPPEQWPFEVEKIEDNLYKFRSGNFRIYFGVDENTIIVCHVCRKLGQKEKPADRERARINFNIYQRHR